MPTLDLSVPSPEKVTLILYWDQLDWLAKLLEMLEPDQDPYQMAKALDRFAIDTATFNYPE